MMWKERYRIGVEEVDQQHKELFERVQQFINIVRGDGEWPAKKDEVEKTLEFMKNYVVTHFNSEEEFQKEIDYPDYEKHKEIHEEFKAGIEEYVKRFEEEGITEELAQEFSGKIMTWLINHVAGTDQKIGEYLKENRGGS